MLCLQQVGTDLRNDAKLDFSPEVHGRSDDSRSKYGCIAVAVGPQGKVGRPLNPEPPHVD